MRPSVLGLWFVCILLILTVLKISLFLHYEQIPIVIMESVLSAVSLALCLLLFYAQRWKPEDFFFSFLEIFRTAFSSVLWTEVYFWRLA
jgi:hypothetical protein